MADEEGCSPFGQTVESLEEVMFGPGVQGAGWLVENHHRGIPVKGPGQGNLLPLPAAQLRSLLEPLAQEGFVSAGQPLHEFVRSGHLQSSL